MSDSYFLNLSKEQVLETAIQILKKLNGSASLDQIYKAFAPVIGHDLTETKASNLKSILDTSNADSCLIQPDGTCVYINSANDMTYSLEVNPERKGKASASANNETMSKALTQDDQPQGYVPVPEGSEQPVIEPANEVPADSAAGKAAQQFPNGVADAAAAAKAFADEARADVDQSRVDHKAERQDDRIERLEKAIDYEESKIARHEQQINKDRTGLMKAIHEKEIDFDEHRIKVDQDKIDRLEHDIIREKD